LPPINEAYFPREEKSVGTKKFFLGNLLLFLLVNMAAAAQPTISSLSNTTAERSGRVLIQGSGFGMVQGKGHVDIDGITALITRWSDGLIAAYVPETATVGTVNLQVFDNLASTSNPVSLTVTAHPPQNGRIRWRFQADADYIQSRPVVGGDGSVYAVDVYGHIYALSSSGGLKWIFDAASSGFGSISIGPDGAVYAGSTTFIYALNPDGTLKWRFSQNPPAFILLGPSVGPDGNIYAVGTQGMGVFSLTPQGTLRWATPENYSRPIVIFQEIAFGPAIQSRLYFHANDHLRGVALDGTSIFTFIDHLDTAEGLQQPVVAPDGSVYSNLFTYPGPGTVLGKFDSNGNELWHTFDRFVTSTTVVSAPDVGKDGVVYDGRNLNTLYFLNPDSTVRWQYTDPEILLAPIVSPLNDVVFAGGGNYGQSGFFEAISTAGSPLWKLKLPLAPNGLNIVPMSRARFTPDGQTVYIGTSIPGQISDGYSYLYSVQIGAAAQATLASLVLNPASLVGGNSSIGTVTLSGAAPAGGLVVTLSSNNLAVAVPASVTVPAGASSAAFSATTKAVSSTTTATVAASAGGKTVSATLTVTPATVAMSLVLNPTILSGGGTSSGVVKLGSPAPAAAAIVTLTSNDSAVVTLPSSVTIAAGGTEAAFSVKTNQVLANTLVTITSSYAANKASATLTIVPLAVSSLVLSPIKVVGGTTSTGTVSLNKPAPTGGAVVILASSNTSVATVPSTLTVPAGVTSATFKVTTKGVPKNRTPTISASLGGVTKRVTLTITP
jgi:IPT/TIG domain/PQQ-like domain